MDENATPGTFQVCVRLLVGQISGGETIPIDLTLTQGVALGGTAEGT